MTGPALPSEADVLRGLVSPVTPTDSYDSLVNLAGNAQIVLIGEATHGTQEFYETRAALTKRLIEEKGFRIIALEADWPDALRLHRYVTGAASEAGAVQALGDFRRFPAWMWRNTVVRDFAEWLRAWNNRRTDRLDRAGIFGMDLYSMHASMESVLAYLDKADPSAAKRARERYACFQFFGDDPQSYGYATERQHLESCEEAVIEQLVDLRRSYGALIRLDGRAAEDEYFYAEQNARLVANAEHYYRSMFRSRDQSWNVRDAHMCGTVQSLVNHYGKMTKMVVWAHNSHLGDARATEMSRRGEWNVGQLLRDLFPRQVFNIGFTTSKGTVTAAHDWGESPQKYRVREPIPGSYEALFDSVGTPRFWLNLIPGNELCAVLQQPRLERAIGVIYRPETERASHYFHASLPAQFNAVIHINETTALEPLESYSTWSPGDLPDTYPEGI